MYTTIFDDDTTIHIHVWTNNLMNHFWSSWLSFACEKVSKTLSIWWWCGLEEVGGIITLGFSDGFGFQPFFGFEILTKNLHSQNFFEIFEWVFCSYFWGLFKVFWESRNPNSVLKPILHHLLCTLHKIFAEDSSSRTSPIVLRLLHNYCVDESFEFNVRNSINDTQALELYGTVGLIKTKVWFNFSNFIMSCT